MLKVITKLVTLIYLPFALAMVIAFGEASTLVFIGFHDSTLWQASTARLLSIFCFVWEGCVYMTEGTEQSQYMPIFLE